MIKEGIAFKSVHILEGQLITVFYLKISLEINIRFDRIIVFMITKT